MDIELSPECKRDINKAVADILRRRGRQLGKGGTNLAKLQWDELMSAAGQHGADFLAFVRPFLPALQREGQDVYDGFLKRLFEGKLAELDKLMYAKMTKEERRALDSQVYQDSRKALAALARRQELYREVGLKLALRLLLLMMF